MTEDYSQRKIALLIAKYLQGTLSDEENEQLQQWRDMSSHNEAVFQRYLSTSFYSDMKSLYTPGEEEQLYKKFQKKLHWKKNNVFKRWSMWGAAAVLLLLFAWGGTHYYFSSIDEVEEEWQSKEMIENIKPGSKQAILYLADGRKDTISNAAKHITANGMSASIMTDGKELVIPSIKPEENVVKGFNRIVVPRGGEYKLLLSDNTHIYLNSDSELEFPTLFEQDTREIAFRGEAYFNVAHLENQKPFKIHTAMGDVEVLGTSFNLRCYDKAEMLQLTLEKGSVRFESPNKSVVKILNPGEQLVYFPTKDSISVRCVPTYLYTSWKDGVYSLDQTPLEQIVEDLSCWYDIPMVYESDDLKNITFTGEIKRYENFGEVVQILELTKRIQFRMKGNKIHIMRE